MKSNFLNLNLRDFLKGAVVAVTTAVLATLTTLLQTGVLFDKSSLPVIGTAALTAFIAYITKNLFTNSVGQMLTSEKSEQALQLKNTGKKLSMIILLLGLGLAASAQKFTGFFRPVEKITTTQSYSMLAGPTIEKPSPWLFRPAVQLSAMQLYYNKDLKEFEASSFQSMGIGLSYQHFIQSNGEPVTNYGFSALILFDGSGTTTGVSPAVTMSALQFFNFGAGYNIAVQKVFFLTGITYSFN